MLYIWVMQKGDLKFVTEGTVFNYRIVVLLNTPDGYIFEKSGDGYIFTVGGKARINEDSKDTAKRELAEELGVNNVDLKLVAVIENFFVMTGTNNRYHELSMVYRAEINEKLDLDRIQSENSHNSGFVAIKPEDFDTVDIKPVVIPKIILDNKEFVHVINKEV